MLLGGIALGLLAGLLAGGRIANLSEVRLRWMAAIFLAVVVRFGTEAALSRGIPVAEAFRVPLLAAAYLILLTGLWANRRRPGIGIAFVGVLSNAVVIALNGGRMPIWEPSLLAAGLTPADAATPLHVLLPADLAAGFLTHLGPLADIIPVPLPVIRNVSSIGDVIISIGLGFFLFATVLRTPEQAAAEEAAEASAGAIPAEPVGGLSGTARFRGAPAHPAAASPAVEVRPETGLVTGLAEASFLDRPLFLGGAALGSAGPSSEASDTLEAALPAMGAAAPAIGVRIRRHPYVRLALNPSFSALWTSGVVSLFGDRIHQVALAIIVYTLTGSEVATAFVFLAGALPNLLLGPISGTLVDRWDQKQVMVVSDLLRAAVVLVVPLAAVTNVALVYPLIFLITSISIFFRPARESVMPRLVPAEDLLTANSANWLAETLADIVGYALAGLFVAFLGNSLPLAFWLDAASYLLSGLLILSVVDVPPIPRGGAEEAVRGVVAELRAGWTFLRGQSALLANTAQAVIGQAANGVLIALTLVYVKQALDRGALDAGGIYAFLEGGLGVGNLIGGFAVGLVGAKVAKGRLVIGGYALWGACVFALSLTDQVPVALGLAVGMGIANMVYVIPSQTLFQQLTPRDMIGRVVGMRFSLVFASLSAAMAVSGFLAVSFGVTVVIGAFGLLTCAAGLAGLLVPALRDA